MSGSTELETGEVVYTVSLEADATTTYSVRGTLNNPQGSANNVLLLLLHGGTYTRAYWDWPYRPDIYSFVNWATRSGLATLNIDRLGSGVSDRPPADEVTFSAHASSVHQIIDQLRDRWTHIVLVGHSMGSATALLESSTYGDCDGLVLTGETHFPDEEFMASVAGQMQPAAIDPQFTGQEGLDGYITSTPGTRRAPFYAGPWVEDAVVAQDEATKSTMTMGEMLTFALTHDPAVSSQLTVPTLLLNGDLDRMISAQPLHTTDVHEKEHLFYGAVADFTTALLAETGHCACQHLTAPMHHALIVEWVHDRFGTS
jgi:pimeloyl-ACP methyl ester carboxylesterase